MPSPVEIADRVSRKRAIVAAVAAIAFVVIHILIRPFSHSANGLKLDYWAINAVVLLAVLATGGGLLNNRQIRVLVNDEVSRSNYRTSVVAGYWVAMTAAMAVYFWPTAEGLSARNAVYVVVTASVSVALLVFSYLELRAHRDE
jgi:MFS family permease